MNNNAWFKKEKPLLSLQSMGGGAAGSLMQGAADKTYVDDVFSTYLYNGTSGSNTLTTGIDNSDKGGLIWTKNRTSTDQHILTDTVRGANHAIYSDAASAASTGSYNQIFTSTGLTINNSFSQTNQSGYTYSLWNFAKVPGFLDIVTYTGNGSNRTISHSLGSVPGVIIIKRTDDSDNWFVYHRDSSSPTASYLKLNNNSASQADGSGVIWNSTAPTSTVFSVGTDGGVNGNGGTYVAYVFAGGSATTQYSVKTNAGSSNYLSVPTHSDLDLDGDFTVEFWHKRNLYPAVSGTTHLFAYGNAATNAGMEWYYNGSNVQKIYINATEYEFPNGTQVGADTWAHYAISREGTNTRVFINGELMTTYTSHSSTITGAIVTGTQWGGTVTATDSGYWSNLRVVKGTALYTAAFIPPQSALTNITNTKLLCWNSSTTTGATVSPVTIVQHGTVTSTTSIPSLSDPEGFKFGAEEDQNLIACGGYIGNSSGAHGPFIDLGWEPQWVLIKNTSDSDDWMMFDSMRGITTGGVDCFLSPNDTAVSNCADDWIKVEARGFKVDKSDPPVNEGGEEYVYVAIRRPDGYVGKPAEVGTDVFAMDTGGSSSTIPNYDSGFPVDFALARATGSSSSWRTGTRLMGAEYLLTNASDAEVDNSDFAWDSNVGWSKDNFAATFQSWMWKRHAGFDVVAYDGNEVAGHAVPHSLGKIPEMMWVKGRGSTDSWYVYHKGLDGGNSPQNKYIILNTDAVQGDTTATWNDTAPNSTHFILGNGADTNRDGSGGMLALLFASVTGISKVGYYTGDDTSGRAFNIGFQPRFIVIRPVTIVENWYVLDTVRGWSSGSGDPYLTIDRTNAQAPGYNFGAPTATGFTWADTALNRNGEDYIYYAHA